MIAMVDLFRLIHHNFSYFFSHCYNFSLIKTIIMLHIQKIDGYLKILTEAEVKDFVVINFGYILNLRQKGSI